jgi:dUTP pyrophosphatase
MHDKLSYVMRNEFIIPPKLATKHSACFDLTFNPIVGGYLNVYNTQTDYNDKQSIPRHSGFLGEYEIFPGERAMVPTGIVFRIPIGYYLGIYSRSGLSLKNGLVVVNSPGIIDADYNQECFVLLMNVSGAPQRLEPGMRIAQATLHKVETEMFGDTFSTEDVRNGGFGSTGTGV